MARKYKIVRFKDFGNKPQFALESSHLEVLDWLFSEIQKRVPGVRKSQRTGHHYMEVTDLKGQYNVIYPGLRELLCDNGWTPLDWDTYRLEEEDE